MPQLHGLHELGVDRKYHNLVKRLKKCQGFKKCNEFWYELQDKTKVLFEYKLMFPLKFDFELVNHDIKCVLVHFGKTQMEYLLVERLL